MMAAGGGDAASALQAGLDWKWSSFGDWLSRLDGAIGVNAGFLVGHSTLRRAIMGEDAVGEEATPEQLDLLVAALHQALSEGGLGFSTSQARPTTTGTVSRCRHGRPTERSSCGLPPRWPTIRVRRSR